MVLFITTHLENQLVWVDTIRQAEGRTQVPFHLRHFLDEGQELSINSFLVLLPLFCQLVLLQIDEKSSKSGMMKTRRPSPIEMVKMCRVVYSEIISKLVYLFFCIKDLSLLVTRSPQLLLLEVGIVQSFGDLHARNVDFGVCGNDKLLMSPAQRDSVQGKGA